MAEKMLLVAFVELLLVAQLARANLSSHGDAGVEEELGALFDFSLVTSEPIKVVDSERSPVLVESLRDENRKESLERNFRRYNDSSDFFQLFDDLFFAQNLGSRLLTNYGQPSASGQRSKFGVSSNANPASSANSRHPQDTSTHLRQHPKPLQKLSLLPESTKNSVSTSRLHALTQSLSEWLSRQCHNLNAAMVFVSGSLLHKKALQPAHVKIDKPGPQNRHQQHYDHRIQPFRLQTPFPQNRPAKISKTHGDRGEYGNELNLKLRTPPFASATLKAMNKTSFNASMETLSGQRLAKRSFQIQAPVLSNSQSIQNQVMLQPSNCLPMSDVETLARCRDLETQVGQSLAHNLPVSSRQIQEICASTTRLLKFCWPPTLATALTQQSTNNDFGLTSTGTRSSTRVTQVCERIQPNLSENIQTRVHWMHNNLCVDSNFQKGLHFF